MEYSIFDIYIWFMYQLYFFISDQTLFNINIFYMKNKSKYSWNCHKNEFKRSNYPLFTNYSSKSNFIWICQYRRVGVPSRLDIFHRIAHSHLFCLFNLISYWPHRFLYPKKSQVRTLKNTRNFRCLNQKQQ